MAKVLKHIVMATACEELPVPWDFLVPDDNSHIMFFLSESGVALLFRPTHRIMELHSISEAFPEEIPADSQPIETWVFYNLDELKQSISEALIKALAMKFQMPV